MDRQAFVLGHILHRFGQFKFSMKDFDDRLRLQKFVYLLQAHGIYLGYDFSWYLRGPYCTSLTTAGFMLDKFYDMMPDKHGKSEGFANSIIRDRFKEFTDFVKGEEMNANFLEAAASLHFLLETGKADSHADAVDMVLTKMERGYDYRNTPQGHRADRKDIEGVLRRLERAGLVRGEEKARPAERRVQSVQLYSHEPNSLKPVMLADLPRDMGMRDVDKAVYFMLHDAAIVGESNVELVGKNVFKPRDKRPITDDYVMNDKVVFDIRRRRGIGVPPDMET